MEFGNPHKFFARGLDMKMSRSSSDIKYIAEVSRNGIYRVFVSTATKTFANIFH